MFFFFLYTDLFCTVYTEWRENCCKLFLPLCITHVDVDVNILFLASVGSRRELSMHLLKVHRVYNTYVHLEFKSEKIGGHSSEAANQVEPLCAPPKTPDQLSTHLKKSSSASSASAASASTSSQQFHCHHHQHQWWHHYCWRAVETGVTVKRHERLLSALTSSKLQSGTNSSPTKFNWNKLRLD